MLARTTRGEIIRIVQQPHWEECHECDGTGRVDDLDCPACYGGGQIWDDSYGFYHACPHDYEIGMEVL